MPLSSLSSCSLFADVGCHVNIVGRRWLSRCCFRGRLLCVFFFYNGHLKYGMANLLRILLRCYISRRKWREDAKTRRSSREQGKQHSA